MNQNFGCNVLVNFKFLTKKLFYFFPFFSEKNVWDQEDTLEIYKKLDDIYFPEQIVMSMIKNQSSNMKMLDLGVGAGRSTKHFAPLMKEYVGIDYSEKMIKFCKKRFFKYKNSSFKVMDARTLDFFPDEEFDFILFSYNGLDCMNHEDRIKTLKEIKRVLKPDCYFLFSSHNFDWINNYWRLNFTSLFELFNEVRRLIYFRILNNKSWKEIQTNKEINYVVIRDGAHNFRVKNYFISPRCQVNQLLKLNFYNIQAFNLSGSETNLCGTGPENAWIYYVCKKL